MGQMNNRNLFVIYDDNDKLLSYIRDNVGTIVTPKVGDYFIYRNNLLKIVSANDCERCFFYRYNYCKLMFLEKGNIHCDYDSHINFLFQKTIDIL